MEIKLSLPGIHCEACTKIINLALKGTPGIKMSDIDLGKKMLNADIDEDIITQEQLIALIKEEAGHEAILLK